MSSAEQNMFTYLGVSPILIPTIKKHIGNGYHHLYSFFYSSFATGVSPFLFPCMEETVALLIKGIQQKACFYIIGDKDADGVSAISILQTYLLKQNCRVYYNTPLDNETYGTSPRMLQDILSKKEEIYAVLTVDTGIKEHEFALELKKIGIPLVITDHHTPDSTLPETPYIINPHLYKNTFFPICGAYVALKLVQGLFLAASKEYHTRSMSIYYHPEKNILHYTPVLPHLFAPVKIILYYLKILSKSSSLFWKKPR